jgi:hypothetical protein
MGRQNNTRFNTLFFVAAILASTVLLSGVVGLQLKPSEGFPWITLSSRYDPAK